MIQSTAGRAPAQHGVSLDWPLWLLILAAALCVAALLSIWTGRYHSTASRIVWTAVALLIPILGPVAWFLLGWERRG
jgi:type VI protein secretion system component VasF